MHFVLFCIRVVHPFGGQESTGYAFLEVSKPELCALDTLSSLTQSNSAAGVWQVPDLSIDDLAPAAAAVPPFGLSNPSLRPQDPRQARREPWSTNQGQPQPGPPLLGGAALYSLHSLCPLPFLTH